MPIAAAGIAAGGSILGGITGGKGAKAAAKLQAQAINNGIAEQRNEFNTVQTNNQPYMAAGNSALQSTLTLLGLGGTTGTDWGAYVNGNADALANWNAIKDTSDGAQFGGDIAKFGQYHYAADGSRRDLSAFGGTSAADAQASAIDALKASPLFTSQYKTGLDTILQNHAATGDLRGGNTALDESNFGASLLSSVIQNTLANYGSLIGTGQAAASGTNTAALGTGDAVSKLLAQQGGASASGVLGGANSLQNALNSLGTIAGKYFNSTDSGVWNGSGPFPSSEYGW